MFQPKEFRLLLKLHLHYSLFTIYSDLKKFKACKFISKLLYGEKMKVDKIMADYGFSISSSCSGFEWYKKTIKHNGQDAFITITGNEDSGLPESLDDPILVEIYDLDSGNELEKSRSFNSLKSYLDTLDL